MERPSDDAAPAPLSDPDVVSDKGPVSFSHEWGVRIREVLCPWRWVLVVLAVPFVLVLIVIALPVIIVFNILRCTCMPASPHVVPDQEQFCDNVWLVRDELQLDPLSKIASTQVVVRLPSGELAMFNPREPQAQTVEQVSTLGTVRWLVVLTPSHDLQMQAWRKKLGAGVRILCAERDVPHCQTFCDIYGTLEAVGPTIGLTVYAPDKRGLHHQAQEPVVSVVMEGGGDLAGKPLLITGEGLRYTEDPPCASINGLYNVWAVRDGAAHREYWQNLLEEVKPAAWISHHSENVCARDVAGLVSAGLEKY